MYQYTYYRVDIYIDSHSPSLLRQIGSKSVVEAAPPTDGGDEPGPVGARPDRSDQPLLALRGVSKSYGAAVALREVRLELFAGEAHALVGENGAGKSTLVKVIAGIERPDQGQLLIDGEVSHLRGPHGAAAAGIAVIYQEPTLFPDLSVAENIFAGRQPVRGLRRVDRGGMHGRAAELFETLGVRIDPRTAAKGLSIADQQMVEIAKALSRRARILVMDEPTAALSGAEVARLLDVARSLRDAGAAILFISHRFDEVFALCERVTVLRDGRHISTDPASELDAGRLVRRMVGREVSTLYPKKDAEIGEPVLEVRDLTARGRFSGISFDVRAGEIVGLAGLVGAGRSEVARAVFGVDKYDGGQVSVGGVRLAGHRPAAALAAGLALVPEDRRQQGLVMPLSIERNLTLPTRSRLTRFGLLTGGRERAAARTWISRIQIKADRPGAIVGTLSGGNQQKVVLAKWLATEPKVLIVDEPTRGIDIGTKAEVHRTLSDLAGRGMAILMVSSELPELLGMSDRVLVMHEGRLVADIPRAEATEEAVVHAATGSGVRI
jgi:rhamnose transport system ATP-binding protein